MASCSSNEDEFAKNTSITINFNHTWEDEEVTSEDFNEIKFQNENGENLSIEKLRYLISNIVLVNDSGVATFLANYLLIDLENEESLTFSTENLLLNGTYSLYFTFGLIDENNIDGAYADLNTANFNVPNMLGGGYHYMQFDGKYIDEETIETGFNYHAIRATNVMTITSVDDLIETDTSFNVDLGDIYVEDNKATIEVQMDIAEWFTDIHTWDLNVLDINLMMNYDAQVMIKENGASVFSLVEEAEED